MKQFPFLWRECFTYQEWWHWGIPLWCEKCINGNFCKGNFLPSRNGGIKGFFRINIPWHKNTLQSTRVLNVNHNCYKYDKWKKNKEATDAWVVFLTWLSFPNISVSSSCFCETTKIWTSCSNLIVTAWLFWHSFCMLLTRLWGTFFLTGWECCCVGLHQGKNTDPTWCNEKYSWEVSSPTQSYTSWYLIIKGLLWQLYRLQALYIYIVSLVVP